MLHGSAQDFLKIPVRGLRPEASTVAPTNPQPGQLWTDTSLTPPKVKWYDGSQWVPADASSIPTGSITDTHISPTANIQLSKLAVNPLNRTNHTGTQLAATISDFDTQVRSNRLDQLAVPTANVDVNGVRITNVAAPTNPGDAANKLYVDNSRAGISVKDPVRVAVGGNITLTSPGATLDGVTMTTGNSFLAFAQNTGTENGIYVFNGPTTAATRRTDANAAGQIPDGALVTVAEGTRENYQFIQRASAAGAPGTWTQDWGVFAIGGQTYTAGTGLTITGTQFALSVPVSLTNGGTGATTAATARTNLGAPGRFSGNLAALSAGVTATVTHNLGNSDVGVWFKTIADGRVIDFDWAATSPNVIAVYPDISMATDTVRAVILG